MNTAFEDFRRIALVATVQRDRHVARVMKALATLSVLALLAGVGFALIRHRLDLDTLARAVIGLAAFWLAIVWATMFVPGSVLLNTAANARLLPRQRRRLMQMTAAGWLVCTVAFVVVFGNWATLPLVGAYLIGLPLLLTAHRQAAPIVFLSCGWPMLTRTVLPAWLVTAISSPASVAALCALLLLVGAYALRLLYPNGGDAHIDKRAEQVKRMLRFSARGASDISDVGGPTGKGILRVYALALRRDCRRADPAVMLMHALGPVAHWSAWVGGIGAILLISGAMRFMLAWGVPHQVEDVLRVVAAVGMASLSALALFCTAQFSQQLRRTRGEQALLRLTPLAGDAALLNRRLARQLLKGALRNWTMITASILAATVLVAGDPQALLRQFSLCCLAGQVALLGLLGDYAGEGGWHPMLALRGALLAACEVAIAVGLDWMLGTTVWPWLIVMGLAGAVFQARRSWRAMLAAPVAFPAGRMA